MRKHEELSDPYGCLSKAHVDEPVFIIRAQDKYSLEVLEFYLQMCKSRKVDKKKLDKISQELTDFKAWQEEHSKQVKKPD